MTLRSSLTVWDIKLIVRCSSQIFVPGFFGNVMKIDLAISDGISPVFCQTRNLILICTTNVFNLSFIFKKNNHNF